MYANQSRNPFDIIYVLFKHNVHWWMRDMFGTECNGLEAVTYVQMLELYQLSKALNVLRIIS